MAKMTVYHGGYQPVACPEIRIGRNTKDFGKLHKAHQTHSSCKTYFVLVSTSSYIEDAKIERMENFMDLSVGLNKIFKLDYMGKMIYLHNRKRAIQPDFCVLSWEIK